MSFHWMEDEVVVTLMKDFIPGYITWNPHFTDPSWGELANKIITDLGTKVIFTVKYAWKNIYGERYDVYRIRIEKRTETGSWVLIPGGFHEPDAAEFGNPEIHSEGYYHKNFEIVADESKVFRITAAIFTGGGGSAYDGTWDYMNQTRQFEIIINKCRCCR